MISFACVEPGESSHVYPDYFFTIRARSADVSRTLVYVFAIGMKVERVLRA
jgi:hypothetical protein